MEMENKYASKGVANAGLVTAIVAAVASVFGNNGGLGNIFGGGNAKDAEIAELKAEKYADKVGLELYRNLDGRIRELDGRFEQQVVYNATNTATIGCLTGQVNALQAMLNGLTKVVIPATNICPQPTTATTTG